jgi:hypothetical protein
MPIFTSLLFFFIALALLPLALRNSGAKELRRLHARDTERMTIGAEICEAAARDAFEVELDHTTQSIALLDTLITRAWGDGLNRTHASTHLEYNPAFVMSAYVGDVFVRAGNAEWRWESGEPFIYFRNAKQTVSPFDLIDRKIMEPDKIQLQDEISAWLIPATIQHENANANA